MAIRNAASRARDRKYDRKCRVQAKTERGNLATKYRLGGIY